MVNHRLLLWHIRCYRLGNTTFKGSHIMTAEKLGAFVGALLGQAVKGFAFGLGAIAALRLVTYWAGL